MTPSTLQSARELCEAATPEVIEALRMCVREHVARWYITKDGNDAEPRPDSPAWRALDALDAARTIVPALLDEIERWQNCAICIECGRCKFDEDGCCVTCGRDVIGFIDGRLTNTGVADHFDAIERDRDSLRARLVEVERERDMWRSQHEFVCAREYEIAQNLERADRAKPLRVVSLRSSCGNIVGGIAFEFGREGGWVVSLDDLRRIVEAADAVQAKAGKP